MASAQDSRSRVSQGLPTETWLQIIHHCAEVLSLGEMMKLRRVNRGFNRMVMEAILESDILRNAAYWDPVLEEKILYDDDEDDGGVSYPALRESSTNSESDSDADDYSRQATLYTSEGSDDSDLDGPRRRVPHVISDSEDSGNSEYETELFLDDCSQEQDGPPDRLTPSEDFWIMHLTNRTMGRIKTKPPKRDHMLLKKVAEYLWELKLREKDFKHTPPTHEFEEVVREVCKGAVKYGCIYDRREFFIGHEPPSLVGVPFQMDDSLECFRDALIPVAIYLNDVTLLEKILSREYPTLSPNQSSLETTQPLTGEDGEECPPFKCRVPCEDIEFDGQRKSFGQPIDGRTLIRLGNPIKVAIRTGNIDFCSILLRSLVESFYTEFDLCRADIVTESSSPDKLDFLRLAIETGPPIAKDRIVLPPLWVRLDMGSRIGPESRSFAGVELSKILESTTSLEIFDLAYAAIMAGYQDIAGVWWTKEPRNDRLTPQRETLKSWGNKRIQRAVIDNCMPIVKRLLELGYNLGPSYSADELKEEYEEKAQYVIDSQQTRDIALPIAAKSGDLELAQLLLEAGADAKRKNVRKAIRIAMDQNNQEMLRILTSDDYSESLLNQKAKIRWRRELEAEGKRDMLSRLEMM
ncbi:hypothetical protein NW762_007987 [Fusarium torreyae]|uniref:Uncharacterized protein n=1 Tax=Fusarium torreyae TaxID=1237075 RepID=A0A9W8S0L8_9HYPO|nr:hypothetical protein NW762_007987 [Fusarium torreyae]